MTEFDFSAEALSSSVILPEAREKTRDSNSKFSTWVNNWQGQREAKKMQRDTRNFESFLDDVTSPVGFEKLPLSWHTDQTDNKTEISGIMTAGQANLLYPAMEAAIKSSGFAGSVRLRPVPIQKTYGNENKHSIGLISALRIHQGLPPLPPQETEEKYKPTRITLTVTGASTEEFQKKLKTEMQTEAMLSSIAELKDYNNDNYINYQIARITIAPATSEHTQKLLKRFLNYEGAVYK